jgi:branched-chain amino acid transport system permease protein
MSIQSISYVLIAGLQVGSIYALLGLSYFVILRATNILNFAQGEWMMLAAVFGVALLAHRIPYPFAVLLSVAAAAGAAMLSEVLVIRPLQSRNAPLDILILALLAIMIVVRYGTGLWFGREEYPLPGPAGSAPLILGSGLFILPQTIVIYAATTLVFAAFWLFTQRTWFGRSFAVASIDPIGAQLCGVNLSHVRLAAFALGGLIAAIVGWLYGPLYAAGYFIGLVPGIKGFIAMIIGGLASPIGPLVGGLLLGLLEVAAARYLSSLYAEAIAFATLIAVLLVRPSGLVAVRGMR